MENTKENKLKFLAQYWGQEVAYVCYPQEEPHMWSLQDYNINHTSHLQLKPLSSITDEDKRIVDEMEGVGDDENPEGYFNYGNRYEDCYYMNGSFIRFPLLETYQHLQSKGYALPYIGLSVDKLQQYGWIKLKEQDEK